VRHALNLLRTSDITIEAVALQCGYDSASHLSRHIKRATGKAPQFAPLETCSDSAAKHFNLLGLNLAAIISFDWIGRLPNTERFVV
jgi:AraC-like DNA-binding protein